MISGLQMRARTRGAIDKTTCAHNAYPVWVLVLMGRKYRARCLGCEKVGPVVAEGPKAARQALRVATARTD